MNQIAAFLIAFLVLNHPATATNASLLQADTKLQGDKGVTENTVLNNRTPLKLVSFEAVLEESRVVLTWVTAVEVNNDYFTLEKSMDGISFETVEVIDGAGNSNTNVNYATADEHPYLGNTSYYRLKQTDYDGYSTFSTLVAVTTATDFGFDIYPNPSSNPIISFKSKADNTEVNVTAYNAFGKLVFSQLIIMNISENNILALNPESKLPAGVYTVIATSNERTYNKKLVIPK